LKLKDTFLIKATEAPDLSNYQEFLASDKNQPLMSNRGDGFEAGKDKLPDVKLKLRSETKVDKENPDGKEELVFFDEPGEVKQEKAQADPGGSKGRRLSSANAGQ